MNKYKKAIKNNEDMYFTTYKLAIDEIESNINDFVKYQHFIDDEKDNYYIVNVIKEDDELTLRIDYWEREVIWGNIKWIEGGDYVEDIDEEYAMEIINTYINEIDSYASY